MFWCSCPPLRPLNQSGHRLHNDPSSLLVSPANTGESRGPERERQTCRVTGAVSEIKQESESNRPRDHVAEGSALRPFRSTSKPLHRYNNLSSFTRIYVSRAHRGQCGSSFTAFTWKRIIDHHTVEKEAPCLITIAPVALFKTQKQRWLLIKSCPR